MRKWILLPSVIFLAVAGPALAHPGHSGHDFIDGWQHPLTGIDHLLAMVAVGLLAVRLGGKALWIMPCTFMIGMLLGGIAAAIGVPLPGVEWGIALSVLALGLLIAVSKVAPLKIGAALVALFAVFHGHAHAAEMASGGSLATYAAGFLLATALLHLCGVLGGVLIARSMSERALRFTGGMISAAGILLLCGVI
jgi:urease accessory protein